MLVAEKPYWTRALEARMSELGKSASKVALDSQGDGDESISQAYMSGLLVGRYRLFRAERPKLRALARGLNWSLNDLIEETGIAQDGVGFDPEPGSERLSRVSPDVRARGEAELEDFRRQPTKIHKTHFITAGGGPTLHGDDEHPEGDVWLEDTGFLDKYPDGKYVRIDGKCMEPLYPEGHFAAVIPDPALADYRTPVLVWFAGNGRKVKFLIQAREDGDHILLQTNPPPGERRVITAPVGSRILGIVVEVLPPIVPGRAPRLGQREMAEIISEEMPDLWEDL